MLSVWLAEVSAACLCVRISLSPTSFMVLGVPGNPGCGIGMPQFP